MMTGRRSHESMMRTHPNGLWRLSSLNQSVQPMSQRDTYMRHALTHRIEPHDASR